MKHDSNKVYLYNQFKNKIQKVDYIFFVNEKNIVFFSTFLKFVAPVTPKTMYT